MSITLHRSHPDTTNTSKNYPLVNCYITMGTSAFFMGKVCKSTNFLWQFSMSKSVSLPESMAHQTHYNPINFPLNHHFHRVFQRLSSKKHVSKGSRSWPTSRRRSMKNRNSPTSNACSSSFSRAPLTRALGQRGELPVTVPGKEVLEWHQRKFVHIGHIGLHNLVYMFILFHIALLENNHCL